VVEFTSTDREEYGMASVVKSSVWKPEFGCGVEVVVVVVGCW